MKNYFILLIAGLSLASFGCSSPPVPVEFSKVCELANNGNYVETTGYLDNSGDLNCSDKQGGDMKCSLKFKKDENVVIDMEKLIKYDTNQAELFTAYVFLRDSANSLKKKEYKRFKKEDMEFIGNDNSIITIKDKVKITGKARVQNDPTIKAPGNPLSCSIDVDKIEKQ